MNVEKVKPVHLPFHDLHRYILSGFLFYAAIKHVIWGTLFLYSRHAIGGTSPSSVMRGLPFGYEGNIAFLFCASALAVRAFFIGFPVHQGNLGSALLLLPQSYIVILAAYGPLMGVLHGHYADGVARPWSFIAADQINAILIAGFHQTSYWLVHVGRTWQKDSLIGQGS